MRCIATTFEPDILWLKWCDNKFIWNSTAALREVPLRMIRNLSHPQLTADYIVGESCDSAVGVALGYGLGSIPGGAGNFSLHHRVQNDSGAHSASYPMGTRGSFPEVKRPGREADHSHLMPRSKNEWSYTSIPPVRLHGVVLS
jgi:hypothetical protein